MNELDLEMKGKVWVPYYRKLFIVNPTLFFSVKGRVLSWNNKWELGEIVWADVLYIGTSHWKKE